MKSLLALFAISAAGCGGCNKKKPEEALMPRTAPAAPAGSGSGAAAAPAPKLTADDLSKHFEHCWGSFNDGKWDDFKSCYADDAVATVPGSPIQDMAGAAAIVGNAKQFKTTFPDMHGEPQLELVTGHTIVGVTLLTGTMTGELKPAMPATNNKIGIYFAQVIDLDDRGRGTHEADFYDLATLLGQMKPDPKRPVRAAIDKPAMPKEVVIAKDDDKEKANLAAVKKMMDAFSAHDAKAYGELLADDVQWSEQAAPKDLDKKTTIAHAQAFWKGFSDAKLTADKQWAAGDYVATLGTLDATNDGDVPEMHNQKKGKKVHVPFLALARLEGGKVKAHWLYDQAIALEMQLGLTSPPLAAPTPAK
jgi:ketosteroid isomerase-like protein